jgi:hypothetical protein
MTSPCAVSSPAEELIQWYRAHHFHLVSPPKGCFLFESKGVEKSASESTTIGSKSFLETCVHVHSNSNDPHSGALLRWQLSEWWPGCGLLSERFGTMHYFNSRWTCFTATPRFLRATTTQCFSEVIKVAFHIQVSAGCEHAVLFRSDGTTAASEDNDDCKRKCYLWMTGFCMWCSHSVSVKWRLCGWGQSEGRQCNIPPFPLTQISAGHLFTVLLRRDGCVALSKRSDGSSGQGFLEWSQVNVHQPNVRKSHTKLLSIAIA